MGEGVGQDWHSIANPASPATQPGPERGKRKDHGFKVSADGRLIIRDEEDSEKVEEEEGARGELVSKVGHTAASGLDHTCSII